MKRILTIAIILGGMTLFSCQKEVIGEQKEVVMTEVEFMAMLYGAEEVPAVKTSAFGMLEGVYNRNTKILTYTMTYSDIVPTAWHIHKGAIGVNGDVIFNLGTTFTTPFKSVTVALTAEQEKDLLASNYYVNIHSAKFPSGEIRGQLFKL